MRAFASDNHAGAHPDVLAAVAEANADHAIAYGDDPWTEKAKALLKREFGEEADPWLVFNGTAANVLALGALCGPGDAIVTVGSSHLHVDEAGAPERMTGTKVLTVQAPDGRARPEQLAPLLARQGDEHAPQPRVLSIANSTELGTVYADTQELADVVHGRE